MKLALLNDTGDDCGGGCVCDELGKALLAVVAAVDDFLDEEDISAVAGGLDVVAVAAIEVTIDVC